MNYKLILLEKELELEKIREQKRTFIQEQNYEKAANIRETEKQKEEEISQIVESLEQLFNTTELTSDNYYDIEEISLLLNRYKPNENHLLQEKLKTTLESLKIRKQQAQKEQNFNLSHLLSEQIHKLNKIKR
jgi:hypothetical protein